MLKKQSFHKPNSTLINKILDDEKFYEKDTFKNLNMRINNAEKN